jgi:hypothetical protein
MEIYMSSPNYIALIDIAQRKTNELFDELRAELVGEPPSESRELDGADEKPLEAWTLERSALSGTWSKVEELDGETYKWPDGNVDEYDLFRIFEGARDFAGLRLALGRNQAGEWIGFVLGPNGVASKRGLVYFQRADDFEETHQLVSMIRGGGANGRGGFDPEGATPAVYGGIEVASLRERRAGKWNVKAVVASDDDADTMLTHTAIQARLRGLA